MRVRLVKRKTIRREIRHFKEMLKDMTDNDYYLSVAQCKEFWSYVREFANLKLRQLDE